MNKKEKTCCAEINNFSPDKIKFNCYFSNNDKSNVKDGLVWQIGKDGGHWVSKDNVNHPEHYTQGNIECIDAIKEALGVDGFTSYCKGNVMKYLWRAEKKGGVESYKKAQWYLNRMIQEIKTIENKSIEKQ